MRTALISKLLVIPLVTSMVFSPVSAQTAVQPAVVAKRTTIQFRNAPGNNVVIETDGRRVTFKATKNGVVSSIGKSEGYTPEELVERYKQMRRKVWLNRLVIIPAGGICAALLGSAVGYVSVLPLLDAASQATAAIMEGTMDTIENGGVAGAIMAPLTITGGVVAGAAVSGIGIVVAYSIIFTYATIGFMIGLPGTWLLTKFVRPNFAKASKQIRNGLEFESYEITTGQDFEKYLATLEMAMGQE